MLKSQKHAFWQALIVALIMFNIGIFFGYMLEKNRTNKINDLYSESELQLLDIKALSDIYSLGNIDCKSGFEENIKLADRIYEDAKLLEKYEDASRITGDLILAHKKYDLLRTNLWINIIKLKEKCNITQNSVLYIYEYADNSPKIEIQQMQNIFSRKLGEEKEKFGNSLILIPIAGDNDFSSIRMLLRIYNITSLPTILINEKEKITTIEELNNLENYLD